MNTDKFISVVVPVYNEEETLNEFYNRLLKIISKYSYEIIFVNDGSKDKSANIIASIIDRDKNVKLITFSRNFGHESASSAGIDYSKGQLVVLIDSDLQDPPEVIDKFIEKWREGYKIIYGIRTKRKGETIIKRFTSKLLYGLLQRISDIEIPRNTGDFRLMDRKVIEKVKLLKERNRFFRGITNWVGYSQIGVEFEREKRFSGSTKYNYLKLIKLAIDSITSFSNAPLHLITYWGILFSFISMLLAVCLIILKIAYKFPIEGWTSIVVIILIIGSFQTMFLGIIGEYIARLFIEIKNRPIYLIEEIIDREEV